jgi:hypothetical protein
MELGLMATLMAIPLLLVVIIICVYAARGIA